MFENISNCQVIAFGNAENGYLLHFQNTDNQYRYNCKITPNSTGKELDAETGFSYFGARYLDHTLTTAWLSMDPMADKYPSISPYAYCAWNPVKLVDIDGEEWDEYIKDGKTTIRVILNLNSDGSLSNEQIAQYKEAICNQFNSMISNASDGQIQGEVVFTSNDPSIKQTLSLNYTYNEHIDGMTWFYHSFVNVLNDSERLKSIEEVARTSVHEILHTVRLDHVFYRTQSDDTKIIRCGSNQYKSTMMTDCNIVNNIMNYSVISIDGEYGIDRTCLTRGQLDFIRNEINLQKQGYGFMNGITRNQENYEKYYYNYWNNIPGELVK